MSVYKTRFPANEKLGDWIRVSTQDTRWLTLPIDCQGMLQKILDFSSINKGKYKYVVVVGMGGSSRPADVIRAVLGSKDGYAQIHVMENLDDEAIKEIRNNIELQSTLFISISKSGGTAETMALTKIAYSWIQESKLNPAEHFIAITTNSNKKSALMNFLHDNKVNSNNIFEHPDKVGGRFTFFSVIGMLPAALAGNDVGKILKYARLAMESDIKYQLGEFMAKMEEANRPFMRVILPDKLKALGAWIEQLIAESLGKIDSQGRNRGIIPILERDYDAAIYNDNVFCFTIKLAGDNSTDSFIEKVRTKNVPIWQIDVESPEEALGVLYTLEFATGMSGILIDVDSFNQPGVEAKKQAARDMKEKITGQLNKGTSLTHVFISELQSHRTEYRIKIADGIILDFGDFIKVAGPEFIRDLNTQDAGYVYSTILKFARKQKKTYAGFFPYVHETEERAIIWQKVRGIARLNGLQDVYGIGPVYEHSTAQFLQEGPDIGIITFVVINDAGSVVIPGDTIDGFTCAMQNALQALGTQKALVDAGRYTIRIEIEGPLTEQKLATLRAFFSNISRL